MRLSEAPDASSVVAGDDDHEEMVTLLHHQVAVELFCVLGRAEYVEAVGVVRNLVSGPAVYVIWPH